MRGKNFTANIVTFILITSLFLICALIWAKASENFNREIKVINTVEVESFEVAVKDEVEGIVFSYIKNGETEVMFSPMGQTKIIKKQDKRTAEITTWQAKDKVARFLLGGQIPYKTVKMELDEEIVDKMRK